jgi:hypothetical protein
MMSRPAGLDGHNTRCAAREELRKLRARELLALHLAGLRLKPVDLKN